MDHDPRIEALENELRAVKRDLLVFRRGVLGLVIALGIGGSLTASAQLTRKALSLQDEATTEEVVLSPEALVFRKDGVEVGRFSPTTIVAAPEGKKRFELQVGDGWSGWTLRGKEGGVAMAAGVDDRQGSAVKLFDAGTRQLRAELTDNLLDAGAGVRLYDSTGMPRATLYAERRGQVGLEFTDANRQPRLSLNASQNGSTSVRASDSEALNVAELSVLSGSDIEARQTGSVPDEEDQKLAPVLFLSDKAGNTRVETVKGR